MTCSPVPECRFEACFMVCHRSSQYPGNESFAFFAIYKNLDKNPNLKHTATNFFLLKRKRNKRQGRKTSSLGAVSAQLITGIRKLKGDKMNGIRIKILAALKSGWFSHTRLPVLAVVGFVILMPALQRNAGAQAAGTVIKPTAQAKSGEVAKRREEASEGDETAFALMPQRRFVK